MNEVQFSENNNDLYIILNKRLPITSFFTINEEVTMLFAENTKDSNEIHLKTEVAKKRGFRDRVAHGHLSISLVAGLVGSAFSDKNIVIHKVDYSFRNPVYLDERIKVTLQLKSAFPSLNTFILSVEAFNKRDEKVLKGNIQCEIQMN